MKLLLENWRSYLTEQQGRRLSIFDFDDTIAETGNFADAYVIGTTEEEMTGPKSVKFVKRLNTEQTELAKKTGMVDGIKVELDFRDFDKEVRSPVGEIIDITNIVRQRLQEPNTQVMVLTARGPESEDAIHNYLQTLEFPIDTGSMIIRGVAGGNKGKWILGYLQENPGFTEVEFYDDQDKNLSNVLNVANMMPDVQFFVNKVEHGVIKPVN
tara:strand:+ start:345 stop:980 length:636 start_codon:yes stop_codon:yes gene_type:complete